MITAFKGTVFSWFGNKPETQICISNLPDKWSSGSIYISIEDAKQLKEELEKAINSNDSLIFG